MSSATLVNRVRNGRQATGNGAPSTNGKNGAAGAEPQAANAKPQTANAEPQAGAAEGRDARGRFVQGNIGGPGNPFGRKVAAFRAALAEAVTDQDIKDIAGVLLVKAKGGDIAAAKLLLAYTVGKPTPAENPDRQDVEEWKLVQQSAAHEEDIEDAFAGMPAPVANFMVQAHKHGQGLQYADRLATELKKPQKALEKEAQKRQKAEARQRREELLAGGAGDEEAPSGNGGIGEWDFGNG